MIPKLVDVNRKQYSKRLIKVMEELGDALSETVFPNTFDGWCLDYFPGFSLTNLEQFQLQQELTEAGWACSVRCETMAVDRIRISIPLHNTV